MQLNSVKRVGVHQTPSCSVPDGVGALLKNKHAAYKKSKPMITHFKISGETNDIRGPVKHLEQAALDTFEMLLSQE